MSWTVPWKNIDIATWQCPFKQMALLCLSSSRETYQSFKINVINHYSRQTKDARNTFLSVFFQDFNFIWWLNTVYEDGMNLMYFAGWIEVLMLLLMIKSLADFCRHCPLLSWLLDLRMHTQTHLHAHAHTLIFESAQNTASNLISADVVTHEMVPSLSLLRWYVKTADCLIQPPILTLGPPLNILASLPQSPQLSWKFFTANNSGICMQVFMCVLWSLRELCCQVCTSLGVYVCVCALWFKDKYCIEKEIILSRGFDVTLTPQTKKLC